MRNIVKFLGVITLCLLISMSGTYVVNAETHTTESTVVEDNYEIEASSSSSTEVTEVTTSTSDEVVSTSSSKSSKAEEYYETVETTESEDRYETVETIETPGTTETVVTTTTAYGSEILPENPQTGVADYLLPAGTITAAAGAALKVLKARRFVKQF